MKRLASLVLYHIGNLAEKVHLYRLYHWSMNKSADLDPNFKIWKKP